MGLFDELITSTKESSNQTFSDVEAFMGIILAGMAADGNFSDEELELLGTISKKHKFFIQAALMADESAYEYGKTLGERLVRIYYSNPENFINMCAISLPEEWRKPTFSILANMIFADGLPCKENIDFLNETYKKLSIPADDAISIVDVIKQLHYFDY